ncbi:acetolactate synthase [candidate division KSB1 bacterium]|jgi:hypothetical protein|nr:acetolactate synthase [candidate division KSB1 bacterium]
MYIKQLSIFLENKSGRLTEVTEALAGQDININALSIADTTDFGILRLIVNQPDKAVDILKERGFSVNLTTVICLIVPHQPGGLAKALRILSDNGIGIEYLYAYEFGDRASVILRTEEPEKAIETLQDHKMELLKASDVYEI